MVQEKKGCGKERERVRGTANRARRYESNERKKNDGGRGGRGDTISRRWESRKKEREHKEGYGRERQAKKETDKN